MKFLVVSKFEDVSSIQKELIAMEVPEAEIMTAVTAEKAFELCQKTAFDVVVTGMLFTPGAMSGIDLARRLTELTGKRPATILISSLVPTFEEAEAFNFHLDKCSDLVEGLRNVVRSLHRLWCV